MNSIAKSRLRQSYAAISCNMCTLMAGASCYWFSPIITLLTSSESPVPLTSEQSSWLMTILPFGSFFSCTQAGNSLNRWGRKRVLLTAFPLIAMTWLILIFTRSVIGLFVARFLQGMAGGITFTAAPIYVAEISESNIRGRLCGLFQIMWNSGILWGFCTGPFLTYDQYIYVTASLCFVFLATFSFLPETPHYLLMKGREDDARRSLQFFRSGDVEVELDSMKQSLLEEKKDSKTDNFMDLLRTSHDRKMLILLTAISFVTYMGGCGATPTYLSLTVSLAGSHEKITAYIPIILAVGNVLAALFSISLVDLLGRRPLIYISTLGSILLNVATGFYFLLVDLKVDGIFNYSWIAYACLGSYLFLNTVGLNALMQTLQGEIFSSKHRGKAGGFVVCVTNIFVFVSIKQFQPFIDHVGMSANFFSFGLYAFLGSFVIFSLLRETAGKSLAEIQKENRMEMSKKLTDTSNYLKVNVEETE